MKVISVVGARPNFMKIAPFCKAIDVFNQRGVSNPIEHILVHTGQHYDQSMSGSFFEKLGIPEPDENLNVGSGSHAEQVGRTMIEFEKIVLKHKPDWVVVVGDVNATAACAITAKKELVKLAHIEAGLRSFDMTMPEEINRIVTDRLSDLLFTTDDIASENLRKECVEEERISQVGNIMIDTLATHRKSAESLKIEDIIVQNRNPDCASEKHWSGSQRYAVVTLHRPSNVDDQNILTRITQFLTTDICADMSIIWPVHPRTCECLMRFGLWEELCMNKQIFLLRPIDYKEMLRLNMEASLMLTDSGGIQEECCVLGTPCLTLRWNTERPVTLLEHGGASILVGNDVKRMRSGYRRLLTKANLNSYAPPLWDGSTAERIVERLACGISESISARNTKVEII